MLNEYERCRLGEIEEALRASDPRLDRALRTLRPPRRRTLGWLSAGWLSAVGAGLAGWWIIVVVMLGPLLAATLLVLKPGLTVADMGSYTGEGPQSWPRW